MPRHVASVTENAMQNTHFSFIQIPSLLIQEMGLWSYIHDCFYCITVLKWKSTLEGKCCTYLKNESLRVRKQAPLILSLCSYSLHLLLDTFICYLTSSLQAAEPFILQGCNCTFFSRVITFGFRYLPGVCQSSFVLVWTANILGLKAAQTQDSDQLLVNEQFSLCVVTHYMANPSAWLSTSCPRHAAAKVQQKAMPWNDKDLPGTKYLPSAVTPRQVSSVRCKGVDQPWSVARFTHFCFTSFFLPWDFLVLVLPISFFLFSLSFLSVSHTLGSAHLLKPLSAAFYLISMLLCFSHTLFDLCLDALGSILVIICFSPFSCFIFHLESPVSAMPKHFLYSTV